MILEQSGCLTACVTRGTDGRGPCSSSTDRDRPDRRVDALVRRPIVSSEDPVYQLHDKVLNPRVVRSEIKAPRTSTTTLSTSILFEVLRIAGTVQILPRKKSFSGPLNP
jgi:hypothetical protein